MSAFAIITKDPDYNEFGQLDLPAVEILSGAAVRITLSADDWQLYLADTDEQDQERDFAAFELNAGLEKRIACAATREQFQLGDLLKQFEQWGAGDSEGYAVVDNVLNQVYGN